MGKESTALFHCVFFVNNYCYYQTFLHVTCLNAQASEVSIWTKKCERILKSISAKVAKRIQKTLKYQIMNSKFRYFLCWAWQEDLPSWKGKSIASLTTTSTSTTTTTSTTDSNGHGVAGPPFHWRERRGPTR